MVVFLLTRPSPQYRVLNLVGALCPATKASHHTGKASTHHVSMYYILYIYMCVYVCMFMFISTY